MPTARNSLVRWNRILSHRTLYSFQEAVEVADWLDDRASGYTHNRLSFDAGHDHDHWSALIRCWHCANDFPLDTHMGKARSIFPT